MTILPNIMMMKKRQFSSLHTLFDHMDHRYYLIVPRATQAHIITKRYEQYPNKHTKAPAMVLTLHHFIDWLYEYLCHEASIIKPYQSMALLSTISGRQEAAWLQQHHSHYLQFKSYGGSLETLKDHLPCPKWYDLMQTFESRKKDIKLIDQIDALKTIIDMLRPDKLNPLPQYLWILDDDAFNERAYCELFTALNRSSEVSVINIIPTCRQPAKQTMMSSDHLQIDTAIDYMLNHQGHRAIITSQPTVWIPKIHWRISYADQNKFKLAPTRWLHDFKVIQTLLLCCKMLTDALSDQQWQILLQSPWLHLQASSTYEPDHVLKMIRPHMDKRLSLDDMINILTSICPIDDHHVHMCLKRCKQLQTWWKIHSGNCMLPSQWYRWHIEYLDTLRWSEHKTSSQETHQLYQQWLQLLQDFSRLDTIVGTLSPRAMHKTLMAMASQSAFEPAKLDCSNPVWVINTDDALGMDFDYLWHIGTDQSSYPIIPKQDSIIPLSYQQAYRWPNVSITERKTQCQKKHHRLISSAKHIIMSWTQIDHTSAPSALIQRDDILKMQTRHRSQEQSKLIGKRDTMLCQALPPTQQASIAALNDQLICPSKHIITHRMKARHLQQASWGLTLQEKGMIIHLALDRIFHHFPEQKHLASSSQYDRQVIIDQALTYAILKHTSHQSIYTKKTISLAKSHLSNMINQWLNLELKRPPFRVQAIECELTITIDQTIYRARVDRIDRLDDGGLMIIDYKTSTLKPAQWMDMRWHAQLPLYALNDQYGIDALAIGLLKPGSYDLSGIGKLPCHQAHLTILDAHQWQKLYDKWQQKATILHKQRLSGQGVPQPINPQACRVCRLTALCRHHIN